MQFQKKNLFTACRLIAILSVPRHLLKTFKDMATASVSKHLDSQATPQASGSARSYVKSKLASSAGSTDCLLRKHRFFLVIQVILCSAFTFKEGLCSAYDQGSLATSARFLFERTH
jgi:hypothetical protein